MFLAEKSPCVLQLVSVGVIRHPAQLDSLMNSKISSSHGNKPLLQAMEEACDDIFADDCHAFSPLLGQEEHCTWGSCTWGSLAWPGLEVRCRVMFYFGSSVVCLCLAATINSFLLPFCICSQVFVSHAKWLVFLQTIYCKIGNHGFAYTCSTVNAVPRPNYLRFIKMTKTKLISSHLYEFECHITANIVSHIIWRSCTFLFWDFI